MTIKIEQEAILRIMDRGDSSPIHPPSLSSLHLPFRRPLVSDEEEDSRKGDVYTHTPKQGAAVLSTCASQVSVDSVPYSTSQPSLALWTVPSLEETDDDCTISSCSTATSDSSGRSSSLSRSGCKGVSFSSTLVTEVWTRPRTLPEDVPGLFYSCEETLRFRQEYRQERKMKSYDPEYCDTQANTELNSQVTSSSLQLVPSSQGLDSNSNQGADNTSYQLNDALSCNSNHHRISRVVVMHHNTSETFVDQDLLPATLLDSLNEGLNNSNVKTASDDFFDKESFWSGQIIWY